MYQQGNIKISGNHYINQKDVIYLYEKNEKINQKGKLNSSGVIIEGGNLNCITGYFPFAKNYLFNIL
jgi:hypothetical protein